MTTDDNNLNNQPVQPAAPAAETPQVGQPGQLSQPGQAAPSQAPVPAQNAAPAEAAPPAAAFAQPPYYPYTPKPAVEKPPVKFDKTDSLFSLIALLTGFLFCEFILFGGLGIGVPLFFIAAYAGVLFYGHKSKSMDIKKGAPLFIPIALLLACFVLYSNIVLAVLDIIFLFFLATLQFMAMFGMRDHAALSKGLFFDFFNGFVGRPLFNLDKLFVITSKGAREQKSNRTAVRILLGIVVCIPLLAIILSLLSSADKAFEGVLDKLGSYIGDSFWQYFAKILLGFGIAIPLFGAFYAFRYKNKNGTLKMPVLPQALDRVIVYTILSIVNAVYILFLIVQFNYMFLAFRNQLPGDFIYSEYARRGFFELVAIAVINLGILAVFYIFSSRKDGKLPKPLKTFLLALSFITLVIIGSALSKMVMYMKVYGLTQLRVYTSWFMLLTAAVFLLAIVKIVSRKFNAVRVVCVFFTAWFLALNFAGTDALIVRYNINKSKEDKSVALDVEMFSSLSDSMVPYAAGLLNGETKTGKSTFDRIMGEYTLKIDLADRYSRLTDANWQAFTLSGYQAKKALEKNKDALKIAFEGDSLRAASGQDIEMLTKFIPKLDKFESCGWYLDLIRENDNGWYGDYRFYGYAVLNPEQYNKITSNFNWDELGIPFTGIAYFDNMNGSATLYTSPDYETAINDTGTVKFALDKTAKKLYFNISKNYLYPNDEYIGRDAYISRMD